MAVYDHDEQEQLDALRAWWARYGNLVTGAMAAVAVVAVGWQGLQWYKGRQASDAAVVYASVQKAALEGNAQRAREGAGQIIEQYGGTVYADMAALLSAKAQMDAKDLANAKAQLGWVVEKGSDPALRDLARLRLAAVLVDEKAYDEALKLLAIDAPRPLVPRFADLLGDVRAAQGNKEEARKAYRAALDALGDDGANSDFRDIVQLKLDALGA